MDCVSIPAFLMNLPNRRKAGKIRKNKHVARLARGRTRIKAGYPCAFRIPSLLSPFVNCERFTIAGLTGLTEPSNSGGPPAEFLLDH